MSKVNRKELQTLKRKAYVILTALTATALSATSAMAIPVGAGTPSSIPSLGDPVNADDFEGFFDNLKSLSTALMGICAITSLIYFVISLTKLSASAGNDQARRKALKGVLVSGVALMLFGGATVVVGVFFNLFH